MTVRISIASDYAEFFSKNLRAYYGYEETDKEGNWCFVAEFNGERVVISHKRLKLEAGANVSEGLMKGIALLTNKYKLKSS